MSFSVPGLPYVAIYTIVERADASSVEIVAIYHTAGGGRSD